MRKPILTIFYQFNPWRPTIGGIQTVITHFLKYAPDDVDLRLVGTGVDRSMLIGKWQLTEFANKELMFLPLIMIRDDDIRHLVPTTLKYTMALLGRSFVSDFMHFHRIEPTLATLNWSHKKTLFVHNDIHQQISGGHHKKTIIWQRFPAAYFFVENLLIHQFSEIFSCNSQSSSLYKIRYPGIANKLKFYPNTVDTELLFPLKLEEQCQRRRVLTQELGLPSKTRFLLFVGRMHPQKDPLLMLETMTVLPQKDIHLLMVGDGELLTVAKKRIEELGLSGRVTVLGALPPDKLANLYQICNVLVLSSVYEGLPLSVLESLACGMPVVTTHCGETPYLLSAQTGVVASERSPLAIATALLQVINHPEAFSSGACVAIAQRSSAARVVGEIYSQILDCWHRQQA